MDIYLRYSGLSKCTTERELNSEQIISVIKALGTEERAPKRIAQNQSTFIADLVKSSFEHKILSEEDLVDIFRELQSVPRVDPKNNKSLLNIADIMKDLLTKENDDGTKFVDLPADLVPVFQLMHKYKLGRFLSLFRRRDLAAATDPNALSIGLGVEEPADPSVAVPTAPPFVAGLAAVVPTAPPLGLAAVVPTAPPADLQAVELTTPPVGEVLAAVVPGMVPSAPDARGDAEVLNDLTDASGALDALGAVDVEVTLGALDQPSEYPEIQNAQPDNPLAHLDEQPAAAAAAVASSVTTATVEVENATPVSESTVPVIMRPPENYNPDHLSPARQAMARRMRRNAAKYSGAVSSSGAAPSETFAAENEESALSPRTVSEVSPETSTTRNTAALATVAVSSPGVAAPVVPSAADAAANTEAALFPGTVFPVAPSRAPSPTSVAQVQPQQIGVITPRTC
jgi:hypothetical protein